MLNVPAFNAQLADMGQTVAWRRAIACPCRSPFSGAADPNCPVCAGKGWAWGAPVEGTVALTGQQIQRQWAQFGMFEKGDLVTSIGSDSPVYALGELDRVLFLNSTEPFSVVLHPGFRNPLPFSPVQFDRLAALRDGALVDLELPQIGDDGHLVMGDDLNAGETATLSGRKHPEYFVYGNFPQDRAHYHGQDLPRRVVLRRFDLFGA